MVLDPQGTPEVQEKRLIKARAEEKRLQEGEDEIRSAESYHSETSQYIGYTGYVNS